MRIAGVTHNQCKSNDRNELPKANNRSLLKPRASLPKIKALEHFTASRSLISITHREPYTKKTRLAPALFSFPALEGGDIIRHTQNTANDKEYAKSLIDLSSIDLARYVARQESIIEHVKQLDLNVWPALLSAFQGREEYILYWVDLDKMLINSKKHLSYNNTWIN